MRLLQRTSTTSSSSSSSRIRIVLSLAVCASLLTIVATAMNSSSAVIDACPAERAGPLRLRPEFDDPLNVCCYQGGGDARSSCGDLDHCFGVAVSHPLSNHPGCCEKFPSCVAFRRLRSDLEDLRGLSIADAVVSVLVLVLSLTDAFLFATKRTRPTRLLVTVICLEVLEMCLCFAMVGVLERNDMVGVTVSLLRASCFNDVGNEANIANVHNELEAIRILAVAEAVVCFVTICGHAACLVLKLKESVDTELKETLSASVSAVLDFVECVMGLVGLTLFLLPALQSFDALYQTLGAGDVAVTAPCVRSCCVVDALLPFRHGKSSASPIIWSSFSPSTHPTRKSSASPTIWSSFSPSAHPTERPSLSVSPTALPTVPKLTLSRMGKGMMGNDNEKLGYGVVLTFNGAELWAKGPEVMRIYIIRGSNEWTKEEELSDRLSDKITSRGTVAVDSDGTTIISSDFYHNNGVGRAEVYRRIVDDETSVQTWEQCGDSLLGENSWDNFGQSMAVSGYGDFVIVGAYGGDYVKIYDKEEEGTSCKFSPFDTIDGGPDTKFGWSVAASTDASRLFVSAWFAHGETGATFVYKRDPKYERLQEMKGTKAGDRFGWKVAASSDGRRFAVGSSNDYVKVYAADDSSSEQYSQLADRIDGPAKSSFGHAVSLSGDGARLAIGARLHGKAFVYAVHPRGHQMIGEEGGDASDDKFGWSVSLSEDGTRLAVGAPHSGVGGTNRGLVRVFDLS